VVIVIQTSVLIGSVSYLILNI